MQIGHVWNRAFTRVLASPALEVAITAAVLCFSLYAMMDPEAFPPSRLPMILGAR